MKNTNFLKKLGASVASLAMALTASLSVLPQADAAGALTFSPVDVLLGDDTAGASPTTVDIDFATTTEIPVGGTIEISVEAVTADTAAIEKFVIPTSADVSAGTTLTAGTTTIDSAVVTNNGSNQIITITTATAPIAAAGTVELQFDATVITTNPESASIVPFSVTTKDASGVILDQGTIYAEILADDLTITQPGVILGSSVAGGTPGTAEFTFTTSANNEVPVGGDIVIAIPDEFTTDDIADITSNVSSFSAGGATVASGSLASNVIVLTTGTAAIAGSTTVTIQFDTTVIDTNPSNGGEYAFGISTRDAEDLTIDTGYASAEVENTVQVTAIVQEALILTLDSTAVNLIVDPSVNGGRDQSQTTQLTIKTNARGYVIYGELNNALGDNNGLHYEDAAGVDWYIENNTFAAATGNDNYFGFNTTDATTDADLNFDQTPVAIYTVDPVTNGMTNGTSYDIFYDINVDYTKPAGIYEGVVTYTAAPTF